MQKTAESPLMAMCKKYRNILDVRQTGLFLPETRIQSTGRMFQDSLFRRDPSYDAGVGITAPRNAGAMLFRCAVKDARDANELVWAFQHAIAGKRGVDDKIGYVINDNDKAMSIGQAEMVALTHLKGMQDLGFDESGGSNYMVVLNNLAGSKSPVSLLSVTRVIQCPSVVFGVELEPINIGCITDVGDTLYFLGDLPALE